MNPEPTMIRLRKVLLADEDLGRDGVLDTVKSAGHGGGVSCHKEILGWIS